MYSGTRFQQTLPRRALWDARSCRATRCGWRRELSVACFLGRTRRSPRLQQQRKGEGGTVRPGPSPGPRPGLHSAGTSPCPAAFSRSSGPFGKAVSCPLRHDQRQGTPLCSLRAFVECVGISSWLIFFMQCSA